MSVCFYADLIIYFLAGFLLVLVWKKQPNGPKSIKDRCKHYGSAFIVGLIFAAMRFGLQKFMCRNALNKVQSTFAQQTDVPKLAEVVPTI
jgi:hypothetical protein